MQGVVDTAWNHYHRHGRARRPQAERRRSRHSISRPIRRSRATSAAAPAADDAAPHFITVGPGARLSAERRRAAGGERGGAARRRSAGCGPIRPTRSTSFRGGWIWDGSDNARRRCCGASRWKGSSNSTGWSTREKVRDVALAVAPGVHREISGSVVRRCGPARGGRAAAMAAGTDRAAGGGPGPAHGLPRDPRNAAGQSGHGFSRAAFRRAAPPDREPGVSARGGGPRTGMSRGTPTRCRFSSWP